MLSFFPRGVLDEIFNLIESVSEGFPSYSCLVTGETPHFAESITDHSKAALLLWLLNVCCYVRMQMVFSNMVERMTVAHYVSCFVLFCDLK